MSSGKSDPQIIVGGKSLPVQIRRYAKARTYRLRLDSREGILRLSVPQRASLARALAWAAEQTEWIEGQIGRVPEPLKLAPGLILPLEGHPVRVEWGQDFQRKPEVVGDQLRIGGAIDSVGVRLLRWLKEYARLKLSAESYDMAEGAGLRVASVSIGDPRSRWGSCSALGELRYSWRLIFAPPEIRRAIVAHEVAHLAHMNHSPVFHATHAEILGEDPRPARLWLRRNGKELHRITL